MERLSGGMKVLVEKLDVREFRGVRGFAKPLELDRFTVLVGRNNVGKTAILEALYMLTCPLRACAPAPYGKPPIDLVGELHGGFASIVYGYYGVARLGYELAWGKPRHVEFKVDHRGNVRVFLDGEEKGLDVYIRLLESMGFGLERNIVALYIPDDSRAYEMLLGFARRDEVVRWAEKEGYNVRVVRELVSKVVYDVFTEVVPYRDTLSLRSEVSGKTIYVDLRSQGEGVKRLILAYYAIEYLNPKLVLWDDVEVAAHPGLVEVLLDWLARSGRQVVLSTHSVDVLRAIVDLDLENCRVVVLRKRRDDVVEWRALEVDEVEELLDSGLDIRKLVDQLEM